MGAWGHFPWESDAAVEWVSTALLGDWPATSWPLQVDPTSGWDCLEAWMAAEVVAACAGRPHPELPPELAGWVEVHPDLADRGLVEAARQAIDAVRSEGSELRELCEDDPDFLAQFDDLAARLAAVDLDELEDRGPWRFTEYQPETWDDPAWGEPAEHWAAADDVDAGRIDWGFVLAALVFGAFVLAALAQL